MMFIFVRSPTGVPSPVLARKVGEEASGGTVHGW